MLCLSNWCIGVNKMLVLLHKYIPFMILWHSNWTSAEIIYDSVCCIRLTLEDACVGIVGFLDFAYDDGLKLSS